MPAFSIRCSNISSPNAKAGALVKSFVRESQNTPSVALIGNQPPSGHHVGADRKTPCFQGGKTEFRRRNSNGWDRARTGDLGIFSATLYQLSYPAERFKLDNLPPMSRDFKSAEALSAASSESKHSQVFWQSRRFRSRWGRGIRLLIDDLCISTA